MVYILGVDNILRMFCFVVIVSQWPLNAMYIACMFFELVFNPLYNVLFVQN